jgi:hypothetical protein
MESVMGERVAALDPFVEDATVAFAFGATTNGAAVGENDSRSKYRIPAS